MGEAALIQTEIEERVALLTLNRPPANALSRQMLAEIEAAFDAVRENATVKVIILTGAGRFFCSGADLRELAAIHSATEARSLAEQGHRLLDKIERSVKPVIAAINGRFALGGGLELAMACHLRLAEETVQLGLPELGLGLIPGWGGTQRLPRLIGKGRALELLLTGARISAVEALRLGLVTFVTPAGLVVAQAKVLAATLAEYSALALAALLEAVEQGIESSLAQGLQGETELFARLFETEDKQEGVSAFFEKRRPQFRDR